MKKVQENQGYATRRVQGLGASGAGLRMQAHDKANIDIQRWGFNVLLLLLLLLLSELLLGDCIHRSK